MIIFAAIALKLGQIGPILSSFNPTTTNNNNKQQQQQQRIYLKKYKVSLNKYVVVVVVVSLPSTATVSIPKNSLK